MKILICGATGFMGKNLFEHFSRDPNNEVYGTAFKSRAAGILHFDLRTEMDVASVMRMVRPDVVIQAAATTSGSKDILQRPYIHVTDNAVMNSLLLRAAFDYRVKHFIFLSCGVMYQSSDTPQKEQDFSLANELYKSYFGVGWTKIYIEQMCKFYAGLGMKCTAVRHTNTYGPYDKYDPDHSHVFGATIRKVVAATDTLTVWGAGEEARDLIYVDDVVDAIDVLIQKQVDPFDLVNVSYGSAIRVIDLVKLIIEKSGKTLKIEHDLTAPNIPFRLALDHSYMTGKYGWTPAHSIEQGVELTLKWYKENYLKEG
jgi:nucleoside-diphosphate-sugar epimerase